MPGVTVGSLVNASQIRDPPTPLSVPNASKTADAKTTFSEKVDTPLTALNAASTTTTTCVDTLKSAAADNHTDVVSCTSPAADRVAFAVRSAEG